MFCFSSCRQNHRQYAPRGSGGVDSFKVGKSGHSGGVMVWAAALGNGKLFVECFPQGQKVDGDAYHKVTVKFVKWLATQAGVHVSSLRNKGYVYQQVCLK